MRGPQTLYGGVGDDVRCEQRTVLSRRLSVRVFSWVEGSDLVLGSTTRDKTAGNTDTHTEADEEEGLDVLFGVVDVVREKACWIEGVVVIRCGDVCCVGGVVV